MQKNNSITIILLVIIIVILAYIAFIKKETTKEPIPVPIPHQEEQIIQGIQPTSPYPEFIGDLIKKMTAGQITKFTYNGDTYYSVMTNFATGSGATIYDKNGNIFGGCNASTGPQYDHDYCHNHTDAIEIWSKNKPNWMQ